MLLWILNLGFAANNAGGPLPGTLIRAMQQGVYQGRYRNIGDVFVLAATGDFSNYDGDIAPGTPDSPVRGWMRVVVGPANLLEGEQSLVSAAPTQPRRTVL